MDENFEESLKRGRLLLNRLEEIQYLYFNGRPEWTTIQKNDLKLFLAYVFYDSPFLNNAIAEKNYRHDNNSDEIFKLYKTENQKDILKMNDFIEEKYIKPDIFNSIKLGLTIIHRICKNKCDGCQNFPDKDIHLLKLIRFKLNNKCIFIDFENHRTYTGWDEFIEKNNLPEGFIFYPESGIYDASKKLSQNITPASYKTEKILKTIENISGIFNWASGLILITGSLIFPLAAPIIYISATVVTGASSFKAYRQIVNLRDMYKYENNVSCTKATSKWIELTISAIGVLVAPCYAFSAITSEINSSIQSTRKALTVFRNGACITQCALEIVRVTLDFINDGFKITSENVLKLRLDLFVAMGLLMPSNYIVNILKILACQFVWTPIYKTMEQIPYCLGQALWNSVYFFKNHFAVFMERVIMFFNENLTVENLFFAWKAIRLVFEKYQKQITHLSVDDLLRHLVQNIAVDESVKFVLRGQRMINLLNSVHGCAPKKPIRKSLVEYCLNRVLVEANKLSAKHDDTITELTRLGETRTWEVDKEFCKCYGLEKCDMYQYALWAIGEVGKDAAALLAEYEEHASRPENMFDDEMVVNEGDGSNLSTKGYTFVGPCGILDLELCLRFAKNINPQPHMYLDHELVQPEPSMSLLFGVSAYSINIVLFGIDLINGVPKMSICFFEKQLDSGSSIADHKCFKKLQVA